MPTFTREYSQEFVDKVLPAALAAAGDIESNPHIQTALEAAGADSVVIRDETVYQMNSISPAKQVGLLFDFWLWNNYKQRGAELAGQAAIEAARAEAESSFEDGSGA